MESLDNMFVTWDEPTQARMVAAVKEFNCRLSASPLDEGESRGGRYRIAFPERLAVRFRVDLAKKVVRVTSVQRYGK